MLLEPSPVVYGRGSGELRLAKPAIASEYPLP
jgi:hypothetical protein